MQRRGFFGAAAAAGAALVAVRPMAEKAAVAAAPELGFIPLGSPTAKIIPALTPLGRVIATDGADVAALREVLKPLHTVDVEWHCQAGELTKATITYSTSRLSEDPVTRTYQKLFRDSIEFCGSVTGARVFVDHDELEVTVHYLMPYKAASDA